MVDKSGTTGFALLCASPLSPPPSHQQDMSFPLPLLRSASVGTMESVEHSVALRGGPPPGSGWGGHTSLVAHTEGDRGGRTEGMLMYLIGREWGSLLHL